MQEEQEGRRLPKLQLQCQQLHLLKGWKSHLSKIKRPDQQSIPATCVVQNLACRKHVADRAWRLWALNWER